MNNYKRIPFKNMGNFRDLGGYEAENGMVPYGKLYRADTPESLTRAEWRELKKLGIKAIIDLRATIEIKFKGYRVPRGIKYYPLPLNEYDIDWRKVRSVREGAEQAFGKSLTEGYTRMTEETPERIVRVLKVIGDELENGAVLFHCSAGKDRTGIIAAIIYTLLGVDKRDIIADYQVSATYLDKTKGARATFPHLLTSDPETMEKYLSDIEEKHYIDLFKQNGLTTETINKIRSIV